MTIPYYSQFESPELIPNFLADGFEAALPRDARWASSGAQDQGEYVRWAPNVCGMACLKMILGARSGRVHPTLELARQCTDFGGYVVDSTSGSIKGLIYAPFTRFVRERFGIVADVMVGLHASDLPALMAENDFFLASVHPSIRWPECDPPARGGHLVLLTGMTQDALTFHNPSGHTIASRENAIVYISNFERFFAGRGVVIRPV